MSQLVQVADTKRITEMSTFPKSLTGTEELLLDSGEYTYKISLDSLLGYVAERIAPGSESTTTQLKNINKHLTHELYEVVYDDSFSPNVSKVYQQSIPPLSVSSDLFKIDSSKKWIYFDDESIESIDLIIQVECGFHETVDDATDSIIQVSVNDCALDLSNMTHLFKYEYNPKTDIFPICIPMVFHNLERNRALELTIAITNTSGESSSTSVLESFGTKITMCAINTIYTE